VKCRCLILAYDEPDSWTRKSRPSGAVRSGLVGIRWTNHQLERTALAESNGGKVAHVARRQTADAERLGERHDRSVNEAQGKISKRRSTSIARDS